MKISTDFGAPRYQTPSHHGLPPPQSLPNISGWMICGLICESRASISLASTLLPPRWSARNSDEDSCPICPITDRL